MADRMDILPAQKMELNNAIFDWQELYRHAHDWLSWLKYDIWEHEYVESAGPAGKTIKVIWNCEREIDDYSKFVIYIIYSLNGISDVGVEQNGEIVRYQKGNISVTVQAYIVLDRDDRWKYGKASKTIKKLYEKFLYREQIETMIGQIWGEGWGFYNEVKSFLNLYKY